MTEIILNLFFLLKMGSLNQYSIFYFNTPREGLKRSYYILNKANPKK